MKVQVLNDTRRFFTTDNRMYSWWEQNNYASLSWLAGPGSRYDSIILTRAIACANLAKKKLLQRIDLKYTNVNNMAN